MNSNLYITVEAWADIVIKEWLKMVDDLNIHRGALVDSFYRHVYTASDGTPERIQFVFEYYGKYVDWGVGNGITIQNKTERLAAGITSRRSKPWFTESFYKELAVLRHLLEEKHAIEIEKLVVINLEK